MKRLKDEKINKTYLVKNKIQILHKPVNKSKNINTSTIQELDFRKVRIKHLPVIISVTLSVTHLKIRALKLMENYTQ